MGSSNISLLKELGIVIRHDSMNIWLLTELNLGSLAQAAERRKLSD